MRDVWQKIAYASGAQAYSLVAGVLILTITARWLGPEGRGTVAAVTAWASLFSTLGYLSLGQVSIHRATTLRHQAWLGPTLGSLLLLDGVITVLGWACAGGLYLVSNGSTFNHLTPIALLIGFMALPFMIWENYGSSLLMAVDRIDIYNRAQVIARTAQLILIFVAWRLSWDLVSCLMIALLAQAIVALTGLRYLFERSERPPKPDRFTIKALVKGGIKLHLTAVGTVLFSNVNIIIINHYLGPEDTGYYHLAFQLLNVLLVIPQAASMVIYGKVGQEGPNGAWVYQRKVTLSLTFVMIVIAVLAAALAPLGIPLVVGAVFAPSVRIFQLLLLSLLGMTYALLLASQWIGRGLFLFTSVASLALGALNVAMNAILVPRYGVYGSVWATLSVNIMVFLMNGGMALWCEAALRKSTVPSTLNIS